MATPGEGEFAQEGGSAESEGPADAAVSVKGGNLCI